ncbi:MAG: type II/IV secretion system protein [Candidatus Moranbacteria bacterium]|nr:type II/IV secretion system protein [Candidatus Moranbacteria bacterium]
MSIFNKEEIQNESTPTDFVNYVIQEAFLAGVSDIHIEALKDKGRIRFRINGDIIDSEIDLPLDQLPLVANSLKVMANLSYQTSELPEDGHFSANYRNAHGTFEEVDIRLSIFPTIHGDAIVLRILNQSEILLSMAELGMDADSLMKLKKLSMKSYGMILINGPVGSGKTTTMYSIISELSKSEDKKNIITLEDPVEYNFDLIRQSQIKTAVGFTFAEGMKAILRQDPDIVMIGEIRDGETAAYALEAALSGRSVFSTIHANSAIGTISRLIDLKIERGLFSYALNGAIAQRLVKKICPACSQDHTPPQDFIQILGLENENIAYKKGAGCTECNGTGFKGRMGIFEILEFNDSIRSAIIERRSNEDIIAVARKTGFETLMEDAIKKIKNGDITIEDVIKVVL